MDDLELIKKYYGENMMHLCRKLFPTILEIPGKLFEIISSHFAYSKCLYEDIQNKLSEDYFKDYIYSFFEMKKMPNVSKKNPYELMRDAGYILIECKTEEEIQTFARFYAKDEKLCTFDEERLKRCHVFFAMKSNFASLNRADFLKPQRQDEYGTSLISIQFTRGEYNTLSIKNRYNHTVNNPDATFSNNLDNIIPGLTESFEDYFGFNIVLNEFGLFAPANYVMDNKGIYYRYNCNSNNIYYGPNNVIIDNYEYIDKYNEKEKFLIIDQFVIDIQNKTLTLYDKSLNDSFVDLYKNIIRIDIKKSKDSSEKNIEITTNDGVSYLKIDKNNRILEYRNDYVENVGDNFLSINNKINKLEMPNIKCVGNYFLAHNDNLTSVNFPKLMQTGDYFISSNSLISSYDLSSLVSCGNNFLRSAIRITSLNFPNLFKCGELFLGDNKKITDIDLPNLKYCMSGFLRGVDKINSINLPKLEIAQDEFLTYYDGSGSLSLPSLKIVGDKFLGLARNLEKVSFPNLISVGDSFMVFNTDLKEFDMPLVESVGNNFLSANSEIRKVITPRLKIVGNNFLKSAAIRDIDFSSLEVVGNDFLTNAVLINKLFVPCLKKCGNGFLEFNLGIDEANFGSLEEVGDKFMFSNNKMKQGYFPKLRKVGTDFLFNCRSLETLDCPSLESYEEGYLFTNQVLARSGRNETV